MKMFIEVINQVRSRVISRQNSIETDFILEPVESPPAGKTQCRFKALTSWLHFSGPEFAACVNMLIYRRWRLVLILELKLVCGQRLFLFQMLLQNENQMQPHCHGLLGHLNGTEPSLMLLETHAFPTITNQNICLENSYWFQNILPNCS